MKHTLYYGTRLSENISRREPEGYLLCLNVPVARTGTQDYLPEELGLAGPPGGNRPSPFIPVLRPENEVFSPETIASFEGMPVTNDHPPDGVDLANIRRLQAGHAHNVRRGTGAESDLLLADLIITDPGLIGAVLAGKREISCGYNYELCEENGRYVQRKIRGNHIAVVDAGRAGPRVAIQDACRSGPRKPCDSERNRGNASPGSEYQEMERSNLKMTKKMSRMLVRMAKDGDIETVAEILEALGGENEEETVIPEEPADTPVTVEVPEDREITIDEDVLSALAEKLDRLIALLTDLWTPAAETEDEITPEAISEMVEEAVETGGEAGMTAEEIGEMTGAALESVLSGTIGEAEENSEPDPAVAEDAMRAAIRAVRPILRRMTPRERSRACADMYARYRGLRGGRDSRVYAALASARRPAKPVNDLGRRIMAARNANYRK